MSRTLPQADHGDSSSQASSARSSNSYEICDGVRCTCQHGYHSTPRSFTPDVVVPSDTASSDSEGYVMYRVWRVSSYDLDYSTWMAMRSRLERFRSVDSSKEEGEVGCWSLCWRRCLAARLSSESTPSSDAQGSNGRGENNRAPTLTQRMAYPSQDRPSTAADPASASASCSVARYGIRFPDQPSQPRWIVIMEYGMDEEEDGEQS